MDYPTKYTIRLPDNEALLLRHTAFHQGKSPTAKATELLSKAIQEDCFDEEEEPPPLLQEHLHEVLWRQIVLLNIELKEHPVKDPERLEEAAKRAATKVFREAELKRPDVRPASGERFGR